MKTKYFLILTILASLFSSTMVHAQFGSDVKIYDKPTHNETRVSLDVAFNGWLYAAFTYDSGLVIRMSKDNGDSWETIDSGGYASNVYPAVKLVVTGNDTNNLRLYELSDAYVASSGQNLLYLVKYDGCTGAYMNYVVLDNFTSEKIRGFDMATDYKFPSYISAPYSIVIAYGVPNMYDSLFVVVSVDSGNTFGAKQLVATTSRFFRDVSIGYGRSLSLSNGRLFLAWEQLQNSGDKYGSIYEAHTPTYITDALTTPVNLDSIYVTTAHQLRGPKISCSLSSATDNDSNAITELIAVERQTMGMGNENILGFRNMYAPYGNTWLGFDIVNTTHITQRPDLSFDPTNNNFLLTYFDSTDMALPYLVNNFNLVNYQNWGTISNNYADDTTILTDPRPVVRINPAQVRVAVGWTATINSNGVAMFDAEYRNPVPALTRLSPDTVLAGNTAFTMGISGSKFVYNSIVNWNGAPQMATYINADSLTISVPASAVVAPGTVPVTVSNPVLNGGGGISNSLTFYIKSPDDIHGPSAAGVINIYPNPASSNLSINYSVSGSSAVEIDLYDMTGKLIEHLLNETLSGNGVVNVSVAELANGEYNLVMRSGTNADTHKIIIVH